MAIKRIKQVDLEKELKTNPLKSTEKIISVNNGDFVRKVRAEVLVLDIPGTTKTIRIHS